MSNKVPRAAAPDVATASQEANPSCGLLIALPQTPAQTEPPRAWPRTSLKEAAGAAAKEREVGGLAEVRAGGASAAEASAAAAEEEVAAAAAARVAKAAAAVQTAVLAGLAKVAVGVVVMEVAETEVG